MTDGYFESRFLLSCYVFPIIDSGYEQKLFCVLEKMTISGASRMRAGQGICVLRQGILGHFRPSVDIFGAKGLFKDTFLFEGRGFIPPPPRCAPGT